MLVIPLAPVESAVLAGIGYSPEHRILALEFRNGRIRHYAGFPASSYVDFLKAPSKGRFFSQFIKGRYEVQEMTALCPACGGLGRIGATCQECGCAEIIGPEESS